jgi:hypothetical protein
MNPITKYVLKTISKDPDLMVQAILAVSYVGYQNKVDAMFRLLESMNDEMGLFALVDIPLLIKSIQDGSGDYFDVEVKS